MVGHGAPGEVVVTWPSSTGPSIASTWRGVLGDKLIALRVEIGHPLPRRRRLARARCCSRASPGPRGGSDGPQPQAGPGCQGRGRLCWAGRSSRRPVEGTGVARADGGGSAGAGGRLSVPTRTLAARAVSVRWPSRSGRDRGGPGAAMNTSPLDERGPRTHHPAARSADTCRPLMTTAGQIHGGGAGVGDLAFRRTLEIGPAPPKPARPPRNGVSFAQYAIGDCRRNMAGKEPEGTEGVLMTGSATWKMLDIDDTKTGSISVCRQLPGQERSRQ